MAEMSAEELRQVVTDALDDLKAVDVRVLDVHNMTSVTDYMVIASGNSDRHVRSLIENVVTEVKSRGIRPLGVEGEREGQWALVDLGDVVVHVMRPGVREFYQLEKLWDVETSDDTGGVHH